MTITTGSFSNVNVGSSANDGTGDDLRSAFITVNNNFSNIGGIGVVTGNVNCLGSLQVSSNISTSGNIIASGVISGGYIVLTAGTTAMIFGADNVIRVTPNVTATFTTTIPPAGTICILSILTSGTTSRTITFGTGFKATATLATGTVSARYFNITFVSDGSFLIETSRTVAIA